MPEMILSQNTVEIGVFPSHFQFFKNLKHIDFPSILGMLSLISGLVSAQNTGKIDMF